MIPNSNHLKTLGSANYHLKETAAMLAVVAILSTDPSLCFLQDYVRQLVAMHEAIAHYIDGDQQEKEEVQF